MQSKGGERSVKGMVDRTACVGSAKCVAIAPKAFQLNSKGIARIVDPDAGGNTWLLKAARRCPAQAIILADDEGNPLYPPP
jgi:ferredoxin